MSKSRLTAYFYLIIVAAIWGAAGPVIKYLLASFPVLTIIVFLTYRFLLSSVVLLPVFWVSKPKLPNKLRDWTILIIAGLLGSSVNLLFTFWGIQKTTALDATLLSTIGPILVVMAGVLFLKEQVTRREALGLAVVIAGTVLTILQPILETGGFSGNIVGNGLIMLANLTWVGYVVISKIELSHRYTPLTLTTTSFMAGFVSLLPIAMLEVGSLGKLWEVLTSVSLAVHAGVFFLGVLSGALAYVLYQEGQRRIEISEANLFSYLSPLFAIPLAVFWLGEQITLPYILGAGIIAAGVVVAETGRRRNK